MHNFENIEENLHYSGVQDLDPREVKKQLSLGRFPIQLIDVRQPDEFVGELGHIPSAKLIVLDEMSERLAEISKDQPTIFVCRSGGRSAKAAAIAREHGYHNTFNLKGGMLLWNELHFPTEI